MIYFVQLDSGAIKIGFTENLDQRMRDLRAEYKSTIALLATMPGDKTTERELHRRFEAARFGRTEQFRPCEAVMTFIGKPLLVSPNPHAIEQQPDYKTQVNMKLGEETEKRIEELAVKWSPVKLTATQVVRECVKRVHEQETKKQEKRR